MRDHNQRRLNTASRVDGYEETMIQSNGAPIALSIWKSGPEDPCIVFFPGTATHPLFYEDFLNSLSLNGFNVIGVHPVCHGKSPRVKKIFSFEEMLQNGKDAITYTINNFNDQLLIMGSSQGGILAIALAGRDQRIKAAFPHNILIPALPDSIVVTRFPRPLRHIYRPLILMMKLGCKLFPTLPIPVGLYLELSRVTGNQEILEQLKSDPLGFMSYPLYFITSLFSANLHQIDDGSIKCPVIVLAAKGDTLFPLEYTQKVFGMIQAPTKELLLFDVDNHLIFNESVEAVLEPLVKKLQAVCASFTK